MVEKISCCVTLVLSSSFILKNNTLTFDSEFYLQIKGTAMGPIFAPYYANLTMAYYEIKVYSIIHLSCALARKYFQYSWFIFLDDSQISLKVNLIKPDHLLSILNQTNNNIQFTMAKSKGRLPFLDLMIDKSGKKIWMDVYNKPKTQKDMSHLRQTTHGIV